LIGFGLTAEPSGSLGDERRTLCPSTDAIFSIIAIRSKPYEEIEAGTLLHAIDRANAMLKERPHHDTIEVWAGNRWIYRAARGN
jgi:hypothetical protein